MEFKKNYKNIFLFVVYSKVLLITAVNSALNDNVMNNTLLFFQIEDCLENNQSGKFIL